jgi:hypothetical protein
VTRRVILSVRSEVEGSRGITFKLIYRDSSTILGMSGKRLTFSNHPFDILGQNIELQIHEIAGIRLIEIGVLFRVRDNPDNKTFPQNF